MSSRAVGEDGRVMLVSRPQASVVGRLMTGYERVYGKALKRLQEWNVRRE